MPFVGLQYSPVGRDFISGFCYLHLIRSPHVTSVSQLGPWPEINTILNLSSRMFLGEADMEALVLVLIETDPDGRKFGHIELDRGEDQKLSVLCAMASAASVGEWEPGSMGAKLKEVCTDVIRIDAFDGSLCVGGATPDTGGLGQQFFKPTGFDKSFEVDPMPALQPINPSHHRSLDEAVKHINTERDKTNAVSVSLEPGSGKTTVLPFRFSQSQVCVILPTGFDALSAFRLASDVANIDTGAFKEDNGSNVTYMDSYTAGFKLFKHRRNFPYQVVIIDESDSNAGITKTLTEIKFFGAYVIHLSGTPGGKEVIGTSGFGVEVFDSLPELSEVYFEAVDFIKERTRSGRNLIMVPNSAVARQIHSMIKNSRRIDCDMSVEELDSLIMDQSKDEVIVADDSCTRGFNLNLDAVFDFQMMDAGGSLRPITLAEQRQRRDRVGRTKPGKYYYTPRELSDSAFSKWDVFRHNVARTVFGLAVTSCDLEVDLSRLKDLMTSRIEPYDLQLSLPSLVRTPSPVTSRSHRRKSSSVSDRMEPWMLWVTNYGGKTRKSSDQSTTRSSTSSSDSSLRPDQSVSAIGSPVERPQSSVTTLPSSRISVPGKKRGTVGPVAKGSDLPIIDLSTGSMHNWPDALRAAFNAGDTLCMVKPGKWVYTNHSSGPDSLMKLMGLIREGPTFTPLEMEMVCRAWNVLVSRMNFSFSSGGDAWGDYDKIVFILDYFSSYNNMILN